MRSQPFHSTCRDPFRHASKRVCWSGAALRSDVRHVGRRTDALRDAFRDASRRVRCSEAALQAQVRRMVRPMVRPMVRRQAPAPREVCCRAALRPKVSRTGSLAFHGACPDPFRDASRRVRCSGAALPSHVRQMVRR
ncbi:unnamed protein product [Chondrus crispus]|uniref:Uncharacterized protein n=1 Tax=Chondrus crispus TaxID=2769 RepID=R7QFY4_CHOCR|nr:unnamed protein product [Chondrus crispus]CDF36335.1 unnamed protein product [Chondrus crispus]|eukprot:XP_005716154.1 unnamed protein product [Chondrus crispus]